MAPDSVVTQQRTTSRQESVPGNFDTYPEFGKLPPAPTPPSHLPRAQSSHIVLQPPPVPLFEPRLPSPASTSSPHFLLTSPPPSSPPVAPTTWPLPPDESGSSRARVQPESLPAVDDELPEVDSPPDINFVEFVPPHPLPTEKRRRCKPYQINHSTESKERRHVKVAVCSLPDWA
ncbi:unnamed protein product [Peniophora sp. CBMAI 1063]|nr:unnamed protein product [Peniophora sp. CBMAI 1063]